MQNVLRRIQVESVTGLPRSSLYEMMAKGLFPRPIRLGARSVGWLESEVAEWVKVRVAERASSSMPRGRG